jgi:hypothetical protein
LVKTPNEWRLVKTTLASAKAVRREAAQSSRIPVAKRQFDFIMILLSGSVPT